MPTYSPAPGPHLHVAVEAPGKKGFFYMTVPQMKRLFREPFIYIGAFVPLADGRLMPSEQFCAIDFRQLRPRSIGNSAAKGKGTGRRSRQKVA